MKNKTSISSLMGISPKQSLELDKLLSEFSTQFANTPACEVDGKIEWGLKRIAECLDLDRCTFWELSENQTEARWSHQYTVPGFKNFPHSISTEHFPWFFKKALNDETVCFSRHEELPEEASVDKESFRAIGEKSVIVIPYRVAGKPICGLSFACMRQERHFPAELIPRLKLAGEIITSALHRKKMEEKYESALQEIQSFSKQGHIEKITLRQETENERAYHNIVGQSITIRHVFFRMEQVAPTDSIVLVLGETGTGKGMIASAIHDLSPRKNHPLVIVNCAALPPNLIESELFGREKGAFTGSSSRQIGRFELADKGTIILDEIAELPLELQAKLLRAIQDGEFERLGSPKTIKVDVRIIALTSRNLKEEASKGRFRQDLYYRLNVFPITIPSLRERKEDIPLLVEHFVMKFARKMRKEINNIPKQTMTGLRSYTWPGNVRELEHVIERAIIITSGNTLHLSENLEDPLSCSNEELSITNLSEIERRHILKILEKTDWRIDGSKGAATLLGLHPNTLRGRMRKLGISIQRRASSDT